MDETIIVPSPNWFQVSGLAISRDGWLVYGGPTKSLCILEPLPKEYDGVIVGSHRYHAHMINRAHSEKIVSVDISPEWPDKRLVLSGSADGSVKQWNLQQLQDTQKIKPTHSHEIHSKENEEIAGVGYSNDTYAITVGGCGNIVKWNLNSNVVNTYNHLKNFKPVCMSCSPHISLNVAVGTKQGLVFVLDLTGPGKIIYKVRGQDDEIVNLSWCPQYELILKKNLQVTEKKHNIPKINQIIDNNEENPNESGCAKKLPEDSFDESVIVEEDDMFDIYKDHEADEFGHKKYQPEEVLVKVKPDENVQDDYLAECLKLKEDIIKRKAQTDLPIQTLVDALDRTHVDSTKSEINSSSSNITKTGTEANDNVTKNQDVVASDHIHKHLLATISKYGYVCVWSKSGKLVSSCSVAKANNKQLKNKNPFWPTLLWYKPDVLLLADGKNNLLECNPLKLDHKNKLDSNVVHSLHKRPIYSIASNAPRVQSSKDSSEDWFIWTTSQERNIIQYSLSMREKLAIYPTCGGFIYTVLPCPYDASRVAVSAGDGAIRVLTASTSAEDDTKLEDIQVTCYWQNVLGKVLAAAWHPTKENLLAFATAESRIGLVDTSGNTEKAARALVPALKDGIYSISWGERNDLYAAAGGELVVYNTGKVHEPPVPVDVCVEGQRWEVSCVQHTARALLCGTSGGAVAVLTPGRPHQLLAAAYVYSKMIFTVDWHPQQTSNCSEESPYKNLMAVSSKDKPNAIVILEFIENEDGSKQLQTWKTLNGHKMTVFQVTWNPHRDGQLLSTSQDCTVRVWDVVAGECTAIFPGHYAGSLAAAWNAFPGLAERVMSGGSDCCLRLWNTAAHPPSNYDDNKQEAPKKKRTYKSKEKKEKIGEAENEGPVVKETDESVAASLESKTKVSRRFLLPTLYKQTSCGCKVVAVRILLQKYLERTSPHKLSSLTLCGEEILDLDYIKMFGSINEVNDLLDLEVGRHEAKGNMEAWAMLCMFRGQVDTMIQKACQRDMLCPYLLSLAPCVSFKYWKDATQLYVAQIDRLMAKKEEEKLYAKKLYGGPTYRKVATLLSIHDVKGAVAVLIEAELYQEAYILCRTRYMDSIAKEALQQWAKYCARTGGLVMAAACYIALEDLSHAAAVLGKVNNEEALQLAADIAKIDGQNMLANHISEKREHIKTVTDISNKTEEILKELPSRLEALMSNGDRKRNEIISDEGTIVIDAGGDANE